MAQAEGPDPIPDGYAGRYLARARPLYSWPQGYPWEPTAYGGGAGPSASSRGPGDPRGAADGTNDEPVDASAVAPQEHPWSLHAIIRGHTALCLPSMEGYTVLQRSSRACSGLPRSHRGAIDG